MKYKATKWRQTLLWDRQCKVWCQNPKIKETVLQKKNKQQQKICQGKDLIAWKKKKSWKQEKKAKGWACALVMKEGNSMPLYRKLLR